MAFATSLRSSISSAKLSHLGSTSSSITLQIPKPCSLSYPLSSSNVKISTTTHQGFSAAGPSSRLATKAFFFDWFKPKPYSSRPSKYFFPTIIVFFFFFGITYIECSVTVLNNWYPINIIFLMWTMFLTCSNGIRDLVRNLQKWVLLVLFLFLIL